MKLQFNKAAMLSIAALVFAMGLVYAAHTSAVGASFGFEKNAEHRKSADAESVAGCMLSCQDMRAGLLEMNPSSPNYDRQQEKILAKSEQCLAMNGLAGFPYGEEEILASCGLSAPHCVEVTREEVHSGACADLSFIKESNLPQCCALEGGPSGDLLCGADAEWTVGVAAFPVCYIPNS